MHIKKSHRYLPQIPKAKHSRITIPITSIHICYNQDITDAITSLKKANSKIHCLAVSWPGYNRLSETYVAFWVYNLPATRTFLNKMHYTDTYLILNMDDMDVSYLRLLGVRTCKIINEHFVVANQMQNAIRFSNIGASTLMGKTIANIEDFPPHWTAYTHIRIFDADDRKRMYNFGLTNSRIANSGWW